MFFGKDKVSVFLVAASGAVGLLALSLKIYTQVKQRQEHAEVSALLSSGGDKVHLFAFPKWNEALSVSLPCTKVEAFLRMANIPYELHITDSFVSATGCLPCLVHNGKLVVDSNVIINYLISEFNIDVDSMLTKENLAIKVVVENVIEYTTKPSYYRTLILRGRNHIVPYYARAYGVPKIIAFMFLIVYGQKAKIISEMVSVSHLSEEQLEEEFLRDIESIECLIDKKPFIFGDKPCSLDCTLYALLAPIVMMEGIAEVCGPFAYVAHSSVLTEYVYRMTRLLFPECSDGERSLCT